MSKPRIIVSHLSKSFRGGLQPFTLREKFYQAWCRVTTQMPAQEVCERQWVLKDINFTVQPGEIVGVLGKNGAGKTTLLRILSRLTDPTEGIATISGRTASLLEVGVGFHPDLTGRENTFLNGTFLGMRKKEIQLRFNEIVGFAEMEQYIDLPVKRYSKGMFVRLAFSVAVHLNADVLFMDEVLEHGDASFQERCLEKMKQLGRNGKSILFVSHQLSNLARLCPRSLLLDHSRLLFDGDTNVALSRYLT